MSEPSTNTAYLPVIDWPNLLRAIQNRECILVLGPGVATLERDGRRMSLQSLLVQHLIAALLRRNPEITLVDDSNLVYISKALEDTIFVQEAVTKPNYSHDNARAALASIIHDFYGQFSFSDFPVYQQLAKMPFHFVVETNPAPFLAQALDFENKFDAKCLYYHYANPGYNNRVNIQDGDIRADSPLVYHLFGSVEQPDSMVVTERDQLAFLDAILQKENTAGIPSSIAIHFTSGKERQAFDKTFVFLGFDFNQWHLRLILHLIGRYQQQKETYALQNPGDLGALTAFFYRNNFEVRFVDAPAEQFLSDFENALLQPLAAQPEAPRLKVFLLYDPADEADKIALDTHLNPLRRTEFIQTWDESDMLAGALKEAEITGHLKAADIILLLVTANFFSSEDVYVKYLQTALQRHETKETVVIPLLIKSCVWEDTPIARLTTILPRNRAALDKQEHGDTALFDTVEQLKGWCKKIVDRKKITQ
ncbi:MAG: toll/interleukin-1 receptor domain-containing protein [Saprospiraceae bacterium]|jgi:hypothetical protein|nr:toll/interleukin-1 receptor domain-containing protein [Saprospiraceae bacterium]